MSRSQRTTVELLELFVARCRELEEEPLLERHSSVSLTINWDKLAGTKLALDKPPRAELRSALLILRRFVSEREPVHLYRIYNLAYAAIESDELRTRLRESRAAWQNAQESSGISLQADGRAITPERIADLLINGRYFHDDAEKEAELNRLMPQLGAFMEFEFVSYIFTLVRVVMHVAAVIEEARQSGLLKANS